MAKGEVEAIKKKKKKKDLPHVGQGVAPILKFVVIGPQGR